MELKGQDEKTCIRMRPKNRWCWSLPRGIIPLFWGCDCKCLVCSVRLDLQVTKSKEFKDLSDPVRTLGCKRLKRYKGASPLSAF